VVQFDCGGLGDWPEPKDCTNQRDDRTADDFAISLKPAKSNLL
jgi:hypothetical protein